MERWTANGPLRQGHALSGEPGQVRVRVEDNRRLGTDLAELGRTPAICPPAGGQGHPKVARVPDRDSKRGTLSRLIELKHRARALGNEILESSLKLNTQTFQGRRLGGSFNTDELVLSVTASAQKNVQYRASKYAVQAQQAYREFFGDRQLASRALDRAATRSCAPLPLGRVQKPGSEAQATLEGERQKHTKAIQDMVAKDAQSHHSDLDSVVNALADVAAARTSTKRGPESTAAEPQGQSSSSRLSYISS